ncbi:MAG: hypothetical protein HRU49_08260 [Winogradskyella sp.]|uniref:hypothetical protein n=1 Tax=Winogradskyella sp. TaxID=1883156 RepID=UPI0025F2F773|nr:hypothetical protein [Winogradskyella sp.]NRB83751.1 hypothetical protein [Winogradskyella sp.]
MKRFLKYFISISLVLILFSLIYLSSNEIVGFNKTVNWAWDLSNFNYWIILITYTLLLLIMLSIIALSLLKIKDILNKKVR